MHILTKSTIYMCKCAFLNAKIWCGNVIIKLILLHKNSKISFQNRYFPEIKKKMFICICVFLIPMYFYR